MTLSHRQETIKPPKVSICMITYNHEPYIAQALDSILNQKGNISYEIVIGEDCSTDLTRSILVSYKEKYPEVIKLLLHTTNIGMNQNFIQTLKACSGEYIAILEGDDYWIDPLKLQKQLHFLADNPQYSLCATRYYEENKNQLLETKNWGDYSFPDAVKSNPFGTLTTLFQKKFLNDSLYTLLSHTEFADWPLWLFLLRKSNGYILNDITAVYRVHEGGVFSSMHSFKRSLIIYNLAKNLMQHPLFTSLAPKEFIYSGRDKLRNLLKNSHRDYFKEIETIIANDNFFLTFTEKRVLLTLHKLNNYLFKKVVKKILP